MLRHHRPRPDTPLSRAWLVGFAHLVHVDVVVVVAVVNGLDKALELPHGAAVDHQHEGHTHRVLHAGQAVVQLTGRLDLVGDS